MALHHELSTASLLKLCSFIFWGWTYLWCTHKAPDHSPEWYSRVVTLFHGSVATVAGLWQCGVTTVDRCRLTTKITSANYALMLWSWGYFAFDLLWCLIYWTNSYVILCHHISALVAVGIYINKPYSGCTFACTLALMEITNPFLQTRWLLRDGGYGQTMLYYIVEIIYLVMFLSLRGPFCTYLIYKILHSDILDVDEKIISLALYAVSIVFIYEILGYITYKYTNKIVVEPCARFVRIATTILPANPAVKQQHFVPLYFGLEGRTVGKVFKGFANEASVILNDTLRE